MYHGFFFALRPSQSKSSTVRPCATSTCLRSRAVMLLPLQPCHSERLSQHRLPQRRSREGRGVETREGVKGIALHIGACDCCIQEPKVKRRVVTNEDRAATVVSVDRVANLAEHPTERILLRQCRTQRMKRIDASDGQRCGVETRRSFATHAAISGQISASWSSPSREPNLTMFCSRKSSASLINIRNFFFY